MIKIDIKLNSKNKALYDLLLVRINETIDENKGLEPDINRKVDSSFNPNM